MARGGKRAGSGPKVGSEKYGETTKLMRVPASRVADVRRFLKTGTIDPTCPLIIYRRGVRLGAGSSK